VSDLKLVFLTTKHYYMITFLLQYDRVVYSVVNAVFTSVSVVWI
jgi:hypothetical protein